MSTLIAKYSHIIDTHQLEFQIFCKGILLSTFRSGRATASKRLETFKKNYGNHCVMIENII